MTNVVKDLLVKARGLIEKEENWVKGDYVTEVDGNECFCSLGAVYRAGKTGGLESEIGAASDYLHNVVRGKDWTGVIGFNDAPSTTHADVLALFDTAIGNLDKEELRD